MLQSGLLICYCYMVLYIAVESVNFGLQKDWQRSTGCKLRASKPADDVRDEVEWMSPQSETYSAAVTPFRSSGCAYKVGVSFSEGHTAFACCASTSNPASRVVDMFWHCEALLYNDQLTASIAVLLVTGYSVWYICKEVGVNERQSGVSPTGV